MKKKGLVALVILIILGLLVFLGYVVITFQFCGMTGKDAMINFVTHLGKCEAAKEITNTTSPIFAIFS